jgi:aminomethyltransferase
MPEQAWGTAPWKTGFVAAVSFTGEPGFRIFVPADQKADLIAALQSLKVPEADSSDARAVRLEHGKPRYGEDITERYLSQETNQMHAISFRKGCYLGQEIVERVRSRAQIHRVLTALRIRSQIAPPTGTKLNLEGKDVGELTSAEFSPTYGEVVALGYVRIEQVHAKPELTIAGSEPTISAYLP